MKKIAWFICIAMLLALTGCLDIGGSFKPGNFGKTPREQAMVEALVEKYGDLTEKGDPRFLEARMTSRIDDFIPVDTVTKYSEDAEKLYVWFVYDNFDYDEIEVEWIYEEDDYSIHTFKEKTGGDLGRGAFILEQPNKGWPLGNYKVLIRGRGLTETLTFEIIVGATVAEPLPLKNGKIELKPIPGWYFTHWDYMKSPIDITEVEGRKSHVLGTSTIIWDYDEGTGDKNDFTVKRWRTYDDGSIVALGEAHNIWSDPPEYISGTDRPVINVHREVESDWGLIGFYAYFETVYFISKDGKKYVQNFDGTMQMERAQQGRTDMKKDIIISMGNSYEFSYHYEWRE